MSKYEMGRTQKEVYTAEKTVDKSKIRYEFWQTGEGWYLQCDQWHSDNPWPVHSEMWVPQEVIDTIISPDSAKKLLNE